MTDDKGAGEGPYRVVQPVDITPLTVEGPTGNHGQMLQGGFLCNALNAAYAAGRKAERERCALIAETEIVEHQDGEESYLCGTGKLIADNIRGGQDGE